MKIQELMERVGVNDTGRVLAYVKDAIEEINILTETSTKATRINLIEDTRFYDFPEDMVKVIDIRVKNHLNSKDEYRTIPRMINKPAVKDADNI